MKNLITNLKRKIILSSDKWLLLYGIGGINHTFFTYYLNGRIHIVKIDNHLSDRTRINYLVPQDTVLGPVLFIIYIKSLLNYCTPSQSKLICFGDYTIILLKNRSQIELYKSLKLILVNTYVLLKLF